MNKMQKLLCLLLILPFTSLAQQAKPDSSSLYSGIHFEEDLSWDNILNKSKAENKYIFVDCYATWCGPCRYMSQTIFPQREVGDYFNSHFINVSVQMDQTVQDSKSIRQWYEDAKLIDKKYGIAVYPTYLFLAPGGLAIDRMSGGTETASEFIEKVKGVYSSGKKYYAFIEQYKQHLDDSLFLRNCLEKAIAMGDQASSSSIGDAYIDCVKNPYAKENISLIIKITKSVKDRGFQYLLANPSIADQAVGERTYIEQILRIMIAQGVSDSLLADRNSIIDWNKITFSLKGKYPTIGNDNDLIKVVETILTHGILKQEIIAFYPDDTPEADWNEIGKRIKKRLQGYDLDQDVAEQKIAYYKYKKNDIKFSRALIQFANRFGNKLPNDKLNYISWYDVFLYSEKKDVLQVGLKLSKRSIDGYPHVEPSHVDTYANLLYKIGDKENALLWEKRALDLASAGQKKEFATNLEKMQRNEKTWPSSR